MVLNGDTVPAKKVRKQVDELLELAEKFDAEIIRKKIQEILPEYNGNESNVPI